MNYRAKIVFVLCMALLVASLPLAGACGPGKEKVIKIGALWDATGPASSSGLQAIDCMEDYVRYINEQGGIQGVRIDWVNYDTAYKMDRAMAGYKQFVAEGRVLISPMAAHEQAGLKEIAARDQIPLVTGSPDLSILQEPGWVYSSSPAIGDSFTAYIKWINQTWDYSGKGRKPRLAILGWDSPYGREAESMAKAFAPGLNIDIVSIQRISPAATEADTQLLAMKKENPDFIWHTTVAAPAVMIRKGAKRLGMVPGIQFAGAHWDSGDEAITIGGAELMEGFMGARPYALWDEDQVPAVKLEKELQTKYRGGVEYETGYSLGMSVIFLMLAAVDKAITDVGWEKVDGPAVKAALDNLGTVDVKGLMKGNSFPPGDRRLSGYERVIQVQNGKWVAVSDWIFCDIPPK